MLFSQALQDYTDLSRSAAARFDEGIGRSASRRWKARWSALPLESIDERAIERYFVELIHKDFPMSAIRKEARLLGGLLEWAIERGVLDSDPLKSLPEIRRHAQSETICWGRTEQTALLAACRFPKGVRRTSHRSVLSMLFLDGAAGTENRFLFPMVFLGLRTGLRLGNLAYLEWRHVHLDQRSIVIPSADSRWGEAFGVSLDGECVRMLREIAEIDPGGCEPDRRVFHRLGMPHVDGIPDLAVIDAHLRAACRRAGVREGGFHSLRPSCAYSLVREGCHWTDIAKRVDWDDTDILIRLWEEWGPRAQQAG